MLGARRGSECWGRDVVLKGELKADPPASGSECEMGVALVFLTASVYKQVMPNMSLGLQR